MDALLARHLPQHSRVKLRAWINAAEVRVSGKRCKASYPVRAGDEIEGRFPELAREGPIPEAISLDILHEDEYLVVVNKPHGMVVHPAKGHWQGTLTAALAHRYQSLSQVGGAVRPGIVHRLDRDTSGVIVVARDDATHLHLARQFEQRTVEKEYYAVCRGAMDRDRDRIEQPIGPHPYHREKMAIRAEHPESRPASTFFEIESRFRGFLSVRVFPKTGRTHQIRVHMAHVGCPIVCDPLYGGQREMTLGEIQRGAAAGEVVFSRLALHARRLKFAHPHSSEVMEFTAPVPTDFARLLEQLSIHRSL